MSNTINDVKAIAGPFDPAVGGASLDDDVTAAILSRILDEGEDHAGHAGRDISILHRPITRRVALGAVAAVAVTGSIGYVNGVGGGAQAANAATPPLLTATPSQSIPAAEILQTIAARARKQPVEQPPAGYRHFVEQSWALSTRIHNRQVTSAVIPQHRELWIAPDGSSRQVSRNLPPTFQTDKQKRAWERAGKPGASADSVTTTAAKYSLMWSQNAPSDPVALQKWLTIGHPADNGPAETMVAATDLVKEQVLNSGQRAALAQVLAQLPGLTSSGTVLDRAGRLGQLVSIVSDYGGLPTRYELVIDSIDGRILSSDQVLISTPGKLGVTIPAVISYETYLQSDVVTRR